MQSEVPASKDHVTARSANRGATTGCYSQGKGHSVTGREKISQKDLSSEDTTESKEVEVGRSGELSL